jgi:hypothetical protein
VVPQWALRPFADAGGGLYSWDIRSGRVDDSQPRSTAGVGWLNHFYTVGEGSERDGSIEEWLASEIDNAGPTFLREALDGSLADPRARRRAAEMVMAQMMRTPRGLAWIDDLWPKGPARTKDEVRGRLRALLQLGKLAPWLAAGGSWMLAKPPNGRIFVISDNPVTSRLNDWPELADSDQAQVTLPITPGACLVVEPDPPRWLGERRLRRRDYDEVVFRTALAADKWVWSHDASVLASLAKKARRFGYAPRYAQVGDWR